MFLVESAVILLTMHFSYFNFKKSNSHNKRFGLKCCLHPMLRVSHHCNALYDICCGIVKVPEKIYVFKKHLENIISIPTATLPEGDPTPDPAYPATPDCSPDQHR